MRILFTGGGSAGHVVPNLALMEALQKEHAEMGYIGTDGIEKRLVAPWKIPYFPIHPPKFVRGFTLKNLKIPTAFLRAKKEAEEAIRSFKPDLIFSKGGFVALPVVFAAHTLKIPAITHESDLSVGLANKLMAKKCKYVFTSFPETAEKFKNGKYVGSPIRKSVLSGNRASALRKYSFSGERKILLVLGGGSGSVAINSLIYENLSALTENYDILHLCGKGNLRQARVSGYRPVEYEDDMGSAYAVADLVISRAGSNTLFEILANKKRSLLIPLEKSSRGDQKENAEYFQKRGLVHTMKENDDGFLRRVDEAVKDDETALRLASYHAENGTENIIRELRKFGL